MRDRLRTLAERLVPSGTILQQTVQSGAWMSAMNVGSRVLQLSMVVVLAALLDPADFGLMGITLLVLSGLRNFSTLGLNAAAISHKDENIDSYIDTIWGLELARGAVLAGIMLLIAPAVGALFGEPRATDLVRVLALSPVLMALRNPAVVYFQKDLDFHLEFLYQMSGAVARFVVSVGWALVSPTVWALVAGLLASELLMSLFSFLGHEYRPRPGFDRARAAELIDYGKWVTGNSILYFLYGEGDDVIVGWLLSATALGFYQTAYRLSNAPATEITQVIGRVMFPTFSKIQDDVAALRQAYYRVLQVTMFAACPIAFGIVAVADVFVLTFMSEEWAPMIPVMKILAAYGLFRAFGGTSAPLWKAIGRPDYITKLSVLRVAILALLIIPATNTYGIQGTAGLIIGVYLFPLLPINVYLLIQTIDGSYRRLAAEAGYPLLASVAMFAVIETVRQQASLGSGVLALLALVAVGAATYLLAVRLLTRQFGWGIGESLRTVYDSVV
jgi:PST family polysaccharide transporter/lipopolysaccharide exporter